MFGTESATLKFCSMIHHYLLTGTMVTHVASFRCSSMQQVKGIKLTCFTPLPRERKARLYSTSESLVSLFWSMEL